MKRLLYAIRMWLLDVLGGIPKNYWDYAEHVISMERREFDSRLCDYHIAVREICRRSETTYYDWCCDGCAHDCDKRNGWCANFEPVHYGK